MASETDTDLQCVGKIIPRTKRKLQKHLRSAGLEYVSRTGKIIPAKQVAEELCQCPQKCNDRVGRFHRENLFKYFYYFLGDTNAQNGFLRSYMDVRARPPQLLTNSQESGIRLPGTRPPRRITCKYLIPLLESCEEHPTGDRSQTLEICQKAFCNSFVISTKRVRLQREKLIHSMGLNSYHHQRNQNKSKIIPEEEKIFNSEVEINRVRIDLDLDHNLNTEAMEMMSRNGTMLVDDPLIPMGISVPEGVTIAPVIASPDHDRDIAIVNNFFYHQLWKPEYIGAYS